MQRQLRVLLAGLAVVAIAGCGSPAGGAPKAVSSSTPAAWSGAVTSVPVGAGPVGLAVGSSGAVWVAEAQASELARLGTERVDHTVPSVDVPLRLATNGDAVWATAFGAGELVRISATSGRVTARVPVGRGAEGVATGLGAVWVVAQDDGRLVQVNPTSAKVTGRADIGVGARLVTTGLGAVWVSQFRTGQVLKVDAGTLAVTPSAPLCGGPQGILAAADAVWVTCTTDDVALRLDPATLTVTTRVRLPDAPDGITSSRDGAVYVVCQAGPTVVELDPSSGTVQRRRVLGGAAQLYDQANLDIAATNDAVWVSSFSANLVYRLPT